MKTTLTYLQKIIFFAFICLIAIIQIGCSSCCRKTACKSWRSYIVTDSTFQHIPPDTTQQIVVWRMPGNDDTHLNSWLDSISNKCGPLQIMLPCSHCDSSLMLLTGAGIQTFIQGEGGGKGGTNPCDPTKQNCGPSGDGDTLYWSVNYPVAMNPQIDNPHDGNLDTLNGTNSDSPLVFRTVPIAAGASAPIITVAVFDTGVDSAELSNAGYLYQNSAPSCLSPRANNGWNFPGNNNAVNDDYQRPGEFPGHGGAVTKLIVEQVRYYAKDNVRILPVKTHSHNGSSDLFSILCGFAYAKQRGARIINASFGYYAPKTSSAFYDPSSILFKKYIQYYLTRNNILLIAAAGNRNDQQENDAFTAAGLPIPSATGFDFRNLDNINFYPASFAADPDLPNVISVTTVSDATNTYAPDQNYSANVVDLGVNADRIGTNFYYFQNPLYSNRYCSGSSYATPIVTGIITSLYTGLNTDISAQPFNKQAFLRDLLITPYGRLLTGTEPLSQKIKTGIIYNKARPYKN